MANAYTGRASIKISNKECALVYDWDALAEFETEFEDKGILKRLTDASIGDLVKLALIGLKKHHPDMVADDIKQASPPIMLLAKAIDAAFLYAYWGPEEAEKILKNVDKLQSDLDEVSQKKTR